jgi:HNH endonuclease
MVNLVKRKKTATDVRTLVLHEAGYKCGNPVCRHVITLDIHHLTPVAQDGENVPENLLPLCPNCHALHHRGEIPMQSLRAWKQLLLALNEAFDRPSVDTLLTLSKLHKLYVTGDGLLACVSLVAGGLIDVLHGQHYSEPGEYQWDFGGAPIYTITLSERGKSFVAAWKSGNQIDAVNG